MVMGGYAFVFCAIISILEAGRGRIFFSHQTDLRIISRWPSRGLFGRAGYDGVFVVALRRTYPSTHGAPGTDLGSRDGVSTAGPASYRVMVDNYYNCCVSPFQIARRLY